MKAHIIVKWDDGVVQHFDIEVEEPSDLDDALRELLV